MNKKTLTEADIRTKYITPAIDREKQGGWDIMSQVLEGNNFTKSIKMHSLLDERVKIPLTNRYQHLPHLSTMCTTGGFFLPLYQEVPE